jgi:hypothetical protein
MYPIGERPAQVAHDDEMAVLREMINVKPSDFKGLINEFLSHDGEFRRRIV